MNKIRKYIKWVYLGGAFVALIVGGYVAILGNDSQNPVIIFMGFGLLAGGVLLGREFFRYGQVRHDKSVSDDSVSKEPPNSLVINVDDIKWAYMNKPVGVEWKCLNNGKYYHIAIQIPAKQSKLVELILPDEDDKAIIYDPGEMANVLTMPSNKKYYTWSASTMQKISIGIMGIIIAGEIVGIVALGG